MTKKFRIWDTETKTFLQELAPYYWHVPRSLENFDEEIFGEANLHDFSTILNNRGFEIQQWTGLTDSQGVEIYEGDIVEQVSHSVFSTTYEKDGKLIPVYPIGWRFEVKYRRYKMSPFDLSAENDFKVIGNIFQNPELLENS